MKLFHFYTMWNWTLLLLNILVEALALHQSFKKQINKFFVSFPLFIGFCLLVDLGTVFMSFVVQVTSYNGLLYYSHIAWNYYWITQLIASSLMLFLCYQIVTEVVAWKSLVILWCLTISLIVIVSAFTLTQNGFTAGGTLLFATIIDFASAITLLAIGVVKTTKWSKEFALLLSGIVASVMLHGFCSIGAAYLKTLVGLFNIGAPLSSLIGMLLFTWFTYSLSPTKTSKPAV